MSEGAAAKTASSEETFEGGKVQGSVVVVVCGAEVGVNTHLEEVPGQLHLAKEAGIVEEGETERRRVLAFAQTHKGPHCRSRSGHRGESGG